MAASVTIISAADSDRGEIDVTLELANGGYEDLGRFNAYSEARDVAEDAAFTHDAELIDEIATAG